MKDNLTFAIAGSIITVLASLWFYRKKRGHSILKVDKLIIYPIRSLKGIIVDSAEVTQTGLKYGKFVDRQFALATVDGFSVTLTNTPKLSLIQISFQSEDELILRASTLEPLVVKHRDRSEPDDIVQIIETSRGVIKGIDIGDEAAAWFQNFLDKPNVRLFQHTDDLPLRDGHVMVDNKVVPDEDIKIRFQFFSPIHLTSNVSLSILNKKMPSKKVTHANFRPNIVINGRIPFEEDFWKSVIINGVNYEFMMKCARCVITNVDIERGEKGKETLKVLRTFRLAESDNEIQAFKNDPLFGIHLRPIQEGTVSIGDEISIANLKQNLLENQFSSKSY